MAFRIGQKVKVKPGYETYELESQLIGELILIDGDEILVHFKITYEQLKITGWYYDHRVGDMYLVERWFPRNSLTPYLELTDTQKAELMLLKSKANRSPVEEYILFGLEN